eukprot:3122940-Rhodomonas_salina.2
MQGSDMAAAPVARIGQGVGTALRGGRITSLAVNHVEAPQQSATPNPFLKAYSTDNIMEGNMREVIIRYCNAPGVSCSWRRKGSIGDMA